MKAYTEKELMKKWPMDDIPDVVREFAVAWGSPFNLDIRDTVKLARDMLNVFEQLRGKPLLQSKSPSNEQAFIEWLSREIYYLESIPLTEYGDGKRAAFQKIKDYFISLTNPTNKE